MCVAQLLQGTLGLFLVFLYLWDLMLQLCASRPFCHFLITFQIRKFLSFDSSKTLVHTFITSKVDYCNSLLYGQPKCVLRDLQRVLNCSAGLVYSTSKFEHFTPLFLNLHWLPVKQRIIFKIALITFKAIHDSVPSYITELIRTYKPDRTPRPSSHNLLAVPRFNLKTYGGMEQPSSRITNMCICFNFQV